MNDLGNRASAIGLTAKQVAGACGLHPNTVSQIFKGRGDHLRSTEDKVFAVIARAERERLAQLSHRVLAEGRAA